MSTIGSPSASGASSTLAHLHWRSEREGKTRAVARWWADGAWHSMPNWRFERQVIRAALFLRERLHVAPGDRVLVASPLTVERMIAEWALVTLGAVAVSLDASPYDLAGLGPRELRLKAAFVAGAGPARALIEGPEGLPAEAVVSFDPGALPEGARSWSEVIELGGTLDTAERATGFRAHAGSLTPDMPALESLGRYGATRAWTQGEAVRWIQALWDRVSPRDGDVAYFTEPYACSSTCLPILAFAADGRTSTVFGTRGCYAEETRALSPTLLVVPPGVEALASSGFLGIGAEHGAARPPLRELVRRIIPKAAPKAPRKTVREVMTFEGIPIT